MALGGTSAELSNSRFAAHRPRSPIPESSSCPSSSFSSTEEEEEEQEEQEEEKEEEEEEEEKDDIVPGECIPLSVQFFANVHSRL